MGLKKKPFKLSCDYKGDGFGTRNKSLKFLHDKNFTGAWNKTADLIYAMTDEQVPDIRWRAHIALWAAKQALSKEGDFVECGVHTGILSGVICRALEWQKQKRQYWLFDTWSGIPIENLAENELETAHTCNELLYHKRDIFENVQKAFSSFSNCSLVRGFLPDTLATVPLEKIAYLSIDLNSATYEKACIEVLWPKLVSGAIIVLDDYAFGGHSAQQEMWDEFATSKSLMIATLPTGQGLLIKP